MARIWGFDYHLRLAARAVLMVPASVIVSATDDLKTWGPGAIVRRRDLITALSNAAAIWPLAAHAQHQVELPTIGVRGTNPAVWSPWTAAFVERLRPLGWVEDEVIE